MMEWLQAVWDWLTGNFSAVIAGGLGLWLLQTVHSLWRDRGDRRRKAQYLAIRLAVLFEAYAIKCADAVTRHKVHEQSDGHAGSEITKLPELGELPQSPLWENLDTSLHVRVASFENVLNIFRADAAGIYDVVGDVDEVITHYLKAAKTTGWEAWSIAADLRQRYHIPAFSFDLISYDFRDDLRPD